MLNEVTDIKLLNSRETAKILRVNPSVVYRLWDSGKLTWWEINGTKKTTEEAIKSFLFATQCKKL